VFCQLNQAHRTTNRLFTLTLNIWNTAAIDSHQFPSPARALDCRVALERIYCEHNTAIFSSYTFCSNDNLDYLDVAQTGQASTDYCNHTDTLRSIFHYQVVIAPISIIDPHKLNKGFSFKTPQELMERELNGGIIRVALDS
jgi:hypothetical protein